MESEPFSLEATGRSRRRLRTNALATSAAIGAAGIAVGLLVILVGSVLVKAFDALNWNLFVKGPAVFGETGGGIAPAFVGSIILVAIATAIALPVGVLVALYVSEFAPKRIADQVKLWLDVLNGVPVDRHRSLRLRARRLGTRPDPRDRPSPERVGRGLRACR